MGKGFNLIKAPHPNPIQFSLPPLGIANICSYLMQKGHEVNQEDLGITCQANSIKPFGDPEAVPKMLQLIDYRDFEVTAVEYNKSNLGLVLELCRELKKTGTVVCLGGLSYDIDEKILDNDSVDYLIAGDAAASLDMIHKVNAGLARKTDIPNALYRDGDRVVATGKETLPIREYGIPVFDEEFLDHYSRHPLANGARVIPYSFTKGCAYSCVFCHDCSSDTRFQSKDIPTAAGEMRKLAETYRTKNIFLLNNLVNPAKGFFDSFCSALAGAGIMWTDSARPEGIDKGSAEKAREAGCIGLVFGIETFSDRVLGLMSKKTTSAAISLVLESTSAAGIWNHANLMLGFPGETPEDIKECLLLFEKNIGAIDSYSVCQFQLLPYIDVYLNPGRYGISIREPGLHTGKYHLPFDGPDMKWEERKQVLEEAFRGLEGIWKMHKSYSHDISMLQLYTPYSVHREKAEVIRSFQ